MPYEMGFLSVFSLPSGCLIRKTKQLALISTSSSNFSKRLRIEWIWGMSWPHLHLLFQRGTELQRWGGIVALLYVCCDYTLKLSLRALPAIPCANFDIEGMLKL